MEEETPYLMVLRGSQIVDVSLTPKESKTGYITPIVGVEGGRFIEYDRRDRIIYWLQGIITIFFSTLFVLQSLLRIQKSLKENFIIY